jgi:hypothetical protein
MIKSLVVLLTLVFCTNIYGIDASYCYQPTVSYSYYRAPIVTFVPTFVQRRFDEYPWGIRPIVSQNLTIYPLPNMRPVVYYYPRSYGFGASVPYYVNGTMVCSGKY